MDTTKQAATAKIRLQRSRALATGLLCFAIVLFVLSGFYQKHYPALAYVKAFAEAAMVGAIADWFAVVALFRHPLGLPIPHTAILPRNQERIAKQLGNFIENNFLQAGAIAKKWIDFEPSKKLLLWLQEPSAQEMVAKQLAQQLPVLFRTVKSEQISAFALQLLDQQYSGKNLGMGLARLLKMMAQNQYQQIFLVGILKQIQVWLHDDETRLLLEKSINDWAARIETNSPSRWDKLVSVFKGSAMDVVDGWLAKKVLDWADGYIVDILDDPEHVMRRNVDVKTRQWIHSLQYSPVWHKQLEQMKRQLSHSEEVQLRLGQLWKSLEAWVKQDINQDASQVCWQIKQALQYLSQQANTHDVALHKIDVTVAAWLKDKVGQYKHHANVFVTDKVKAWDSQALVEKLELSVGKDLQYIRINGTLVGGLVGLLIYVVSSHLF